MTNLNFIIANNNSLANLEMQETNNLVNDIKSIIKKNGYCIVRNLGLKNLEINEKKNLLYKFLSEIGHLTGHNTDDPNDISLDSIFWDIKFRGDEYNKNNQTTFSEKTGDCPLHTDSSFIPNPEDYLIMYVVYPASEGGESLYLSYHDILDALNSNVDGKRCLNILVNNELPFQTPKSFDINQTIHWNKIIEEDGSLRFRHDCIENGIKLFKNRINEEVIWAIEHLVGVINNNKNLKEFNALADDLIVVDNRHGLHARRDFTDINRHYIRARASKIE